MEGFKGVAEKFRVSLVSEDGNSKIGVICQVGLDGLFLLAPDTQRELRKFPLQHISRWALRGGSLVLYTRTPVDVEEHTVTLQADDRTICNVLDTLTCSCMQMVELLQTSDTSTERDREVAESLSALLNGGGSKKKAPLLPVVDEVEFWKSPEKAGWLYSQGDVIKTWRRRYHVLKQGFLFRFGESDVKPGSRPRGIVDLSLITDVSDGRDVTGKSNTLKLTTASGSQVCYQCDSETEQVEWLSALEGSVARIVRLVAGVEDSPPVALPASRAPMPAKDSASEWARQLEAGFSAVYRSGSGIGSTPSAGNRGGNPMVSVVGYGGGGGGGGGGGRYASTPSATRDDYGGSGSVSAVAGYGNIAGARVAANSEPLVSVDYMYSHAPAQPAQASFTSTQTYAATGSGYDSAYYSQPPYQQYQSAQQDAGDQYQASPAPEQGYQGHDSRVGGAAPSYMDYTPPAYGASAYPTQSYTTQSYAAPAAQVGGQPSNDGWATHHSTDGRPYLFNAATGETRWA